MTRCSEVRTAVKNCLLLEQFFPVNSYQNMQQLRFLSSKRGNLWNLFATNWTCLSTIHFYYQAISLLSLLYHCIVAWLFSHCTKPWSQFSDCTWLSPQLKLLSTAHALISHTHGGGATGNTLSYIMRGDIIQARQTVTLC